MPLARDLSWTGRIDNLRSRVILCSLSHSGCAKCILQILFFPQCVIWVAPFVSFSECFSPRLRANTPSQETPFISWVSGHGTWHDAECTFKRPPPVNYKLISLVAIVQPSYRFRTSKSTVRKTVSSFKLDNLSALRSEWRCARAP